MPVQKSLPLICRSSYPAAQAALLYNLRLTRLAVSFPEYLEKYPEAASAIRYLRIEDDVPGAWGEVMKRWLDMPSHFLPILEKCKKLEGVHLSIRVGETAPPGQRERPFVLPEGCRVLSVGKGGSGSGGSLLGTLSQGGWKLHADTVRLECITANDLTISSSTPGTTRNRFISARHLVIDIKRDNPNVYYPSQFSEFLASLETLPRALTIKKMRLDSSAFRIMVQNSGPSLEYLHFTWSAPASSSMIFAREYIDYLYGGRYNPLIVGTVLLPCRNLRQVKIDIVDLVPLRGMRFPPSVKKLTVQWFTYRHFFTEFFPWLQNHLCTDTPELDELHIDIIKSWEARGSYDLANTRRLDSEMVQLVDDYCIAKAATQLCENHGVRTKPANLEQAWKATRKAELSDDEWRELSRRLGSELQDSARSGNPSEPTNPFQVSS
jgi:hypothetical protein